MIAFADLFVGTGCKDVDGRELWSLAERYELVELLDWLAECVDESNFGAVYEFALMKKEEDGKAHRKRLAGLCASLARKKLTKIEGTSLMGLCASTVLKILEACTDREGKMPSSQRKFEGSTLVCRWIAANKEAEGVGLLDGCAMDRVLEILDLEKLTSPEMVEFSEKPFFTELLSPEQKAKLLQQNMRYNIELQRQESKPKQKQEPKLKQERKEKKVDRRGRGQGHGSDSMETDEGESEQEEVVGVKKQKPNRGYERQQKRKNDKQPAGDEAEEEAKMNGCSSKSAAYRKLELQEDGPQRQKQKVKMQAREPQRRQDGKQQQNGKQPRRVAEAREDDDSSGDEERQDEGGGAGVEVRCTYKGCRRPDASSAYRKISTNTSAGGQDWSSLHGQVLCVACYLRYYKYGTLEKGRGQARLGGQNGGVIEEDGGVISSSSSDDDDGNDEAGRVGDDGDGDEDEDEDEDDDGAFQRRTPKRKCRDTPLSEQKKMRPDERQLQASPKKKESEQHEIDHIVSCKIIQRKTASGRLKKKRIFTVHWKGDWGDQQQTQVPERNICEWYVRMWDKEQEKKEKQRLKQLGLWKEPESKKPPEKLVVDFSSDFSHRPVTGGWEIAKRYGAFKMWTGKYGRFPAYGWGKKDGQFLSRAEIGAHGKGADARVVICDSAMHRATVLRCDGELLHTIGGVAETAGGRDDQGGWFHTLDSMQFDESGKLIYGTDMSRNIVQVFDAETGEYKRMFGNVPVWNAETERYDRDFGKKEFSSMTGAACTPFAKKIGLIGGKEVFTPGIVLIDQNGKFHCQIWTRGGEFVCKFGKDGTGKDELSSVLSCVAVDKEGCIYIVDGGNCRVSVFDRKGNWLHHIGRKGTMNGQFQFPYGICISPQGHVFVSDRDGCSVQIFDRVGRFLYAMGRGKMSDLDISWPHGIAMDGSGRLYACCERWLDPKKEKGDKTARSDKVWDTYMIVPVSGS